MPQQGGVTLPEFTGQQVLVLLAAVHAFKHQYPSAADVAQGIRELIVDSIEAVPEEDGFAVRGDVMQACTIALSCQIQEMVGETLVKFQEFLDGDIIFEAELREFTEIMDNLPDQPDNPSNN